MANVQRRLPGLDVGPFGLLYRFPLRHGDCTRFGVANSDVTWGITITLMLRSVGALTFGALSDRFGRKWPFIINLFLFIIFELSSGFAIHYLNFSEFEHYTV